MLPEVRLGEPEVIDNYVCYDTDGVKIYIYKPMMYSNKAISIKLHNFLGYKFLDAAGFNVM